MFSLSLLSHMLKPAAYSGKMLMLLLFRAAPEWSWQCSPRVILPCNCQMVLTSSGELALTCSSPTYANSSRWGAEIFLRFLSRGKKKISFLGGWLICLQVISTSEIVVQIYWKLSLKPAHPYKLNRKGKWFLRICTEHYSCTMNKYSLRGTCGLMRHWTHLLRRSNAWRSNNTLIYVLLLHLKWHNYRRGSWEKRIWVVVNSCF